MKIIIPVAGSGTRLRPLTHTTTKSLLMVGNRRVLGHVIDSVKQILKPEDTLIFITDDNNDKQIKRYINKYFSDYNYRFVVQKEKLGPGHAVWLANEFIKQGDDILIVFNDTIFVGDLTKIFTEYKDCDGLIYSYPTDNPKRFGIITYDEQGNIIDLIEKPQHDIGSNLAIVGLYYVKDGLELMKKIEFTMNQGMKEGYLGKKEYYLTLPLKLMIQDGKRFKAPKLDDWLDCGKKETLLDTNKTLLQKFGCLNYAERYRGCIFVPPIYVDPGAKVSNSIIGPNVSIGGNAEVHDSIVSDSIINPGAKVDKMVLKESLIGENAEIKGTYCSSDLGDDCRIDIGL